MSQKIQALHADWLEDLEIAQGRSSRTVRNYDRYLQRFYTQQNIEKVSDITLEAVRAFRRRLNQGSQDIEGMALATQNYYLIALRQFLKYLAKRDIQALPAERIDLAKLPERDIDVLYPEEIDSLLGSTKFEAPSLRQGSGRQVKTKDDLTALRDQALFQTLFSTGLRVSEAVALDRDDVRETVREIPVRGKGNKVRVVFLSKEAHEAIQAYVAKRVDVDPALFVRHRQGGSGEADNLRLTARTVQRLIKKYAARAGITKDITPHTLRHSYATDLLANGADVRQVQMLLGHASITTTQIYTHLTDVHLKDVHERFHRRKRRVTSNE